MPSHLASRCVRVLRLERQLGSPTESRTRRLTTAFIDFFFAAFRCTRHFAWMTLNDPLLFWPWMTPQRAIEGHKKRGSFRVKRPFRVNIVKYPPTLLMNSKNTWQLRRCTHLPCHSPHLLQHHLLTNRSLNTSKTWNKVIEKRFSLRTLSCEFEPGCVFFQTFFEFVSKLLFNYVFGMYIKISRSLLSGSSHESTNQKTYYAVNYCILRGTFLLNMSGNNHSFEIVIIFSWRLLWGLRNETITWKSYCYCGLARS